MNTIHANPDTNCGKTGLTGYCDMTQTCAWFQGFAQGTGDSGPAGILIYNSFVVINTVRPCSAFRGTV